MTPALRNLAALLRLQVRLGLPGNAAMVWTVAHIQALQPSLSTATAGASEARGLRPAWTENYAPTARRANHRHQNRRASAFPCQASREPASGKFQVRPYRLYQSTSHAQSTPHRLPLHPYRHLPSTRPPARLPARLPARPPSTRPLPTPTPTSCSPPRPPSTPSSRTSSAPNTKCGGTRWRRTTASWRNAACAW